MMDIDEHIEVNYHNSISFLMIIFSLRQVTAPMKVTWVNYHDSISFLIANDYLFFQFSNTALSDYDPLWRVPVKAVQQQLDIVRQFEMEQILIGERFYPRQFNNFRDNPIRGGNPLYEFPIGTKSFYLQARSFNPPKLAGCVRAVFEPRSGLVRAL